MREYDIPDPSNNRALILDTQGQGHRAYARQACRNEEEAQLCAVCEDARATLSYCP
jgi:hypothetical protein